MTLSFEEYSKNAKATCLPTAWNEEYLCTGLVAESGEVAAVLAREIRDGTKEDTKEKKIAELNSALAEFSQEEQDLAKAEIEAFKADPMSVEINSITSKICVEMVRKNKETRTTELNNAPDIFGGVASPEDDGDVDIFG